MTGDSYERKGSPIVTNGVLESSRRLSLQKVGRGWKVLRKQSVSQSKEYFYFIYEGTRSEAYAPGL